MVFSEILAYAITLHQSTLRRVLWGALTALLLGMLFLPLRLSQYVHQPRGTGELRFRVEPGSGVAHLADQLARAGLARWSQGTAVGFRIWGSPERMKAGNYVLAAPLSLVDIFRAVEEGRVAQVTVTFPEGLTIRDMASILSQSGVADGEKFVAVAYAAQSPLHWGLPGTSLEGFLFPDTYRFAENLSAERVIDSMVSRFREVVGPHIEEMKRRGLTLLEWVTLASIVEKEAGNEEEKPKIAGVFLNRLSRKMRLESDPTVIYGLVDFDGNIRREDLRTDTPYNTYTRFGLPPSAIACPGYSSLMAVLHPAKVPYLYFVSRNDGSHHFSTSYEEHQSAVRKFQLRRR